MRDLGRIKGGVSDYHVVSKIDYMPLRSFHRKGGGAWNKVFKPLPIGFAISDERNSATTLPKVNIRRSRRP
jgi:hypothetical protein